MYKIGVALKYVGTYKFVYYYIFSNSVSTLFIAKEACPVIKLSSAR